MQLICEYNRNHEIKDKEISKVYELHLAEHLHDLDDYVELANEADCKEIIFHVAPEDTGVCKDADELNDVLTDIFEKLITYIDVAFCFENDTIAQKVSDDGDYLIPWVDGYSYNFYFNQVITDFELLRCVLGRYVVDRVIIGGELLFNLNAVEVLCHNHGNVDIVVRPNEAMLCDSDLGSELNRENPMSYSWILPQYVSQYERYITYLDLTSCHSELTGAYIGETLYNYYKNGMTFDHMFTLLFKGMGAVGDARVSTYIPYSDPAKNALIIRRRQNCGLKCHECKMCIKIHDIVERVKRIKETKEEIDAEIEKLKV